MYEYRFIPPFVSTLILSILIFIPFRLGLSDEIYVPSDYASIQDAINSASYCDRVIVSEGTYYEHLTLVQGITLEGADGEEVVVDGSGYGTVLYGEDSCTIRNLTLQNGTYGVWAYSHSFIVEGCRIRENSQGMNIYYANPAVMENEITGNSTYGIYMIGSSPLIYGNSLQGSERGVEGVESSGVLRGNTIEGCERGISLSNSETAIIENTFRENVTAIHLDYSSPAISANTFSQNSGTGVYVLSSSPEISGNTFFGNFSGLFMTYSSPSVENNIFFMNEWAGIYSGLSSEPAIMNNLIYENEGIGIYAVTSSPDIYNNNLLTNQSGIVSISSTFSIRGNIIAYNSSYGILVEGEGSVTENYNDLWGNDVDIEGLTPGSGTLFEDPLFADYSPDGDYENDDFSLQEASPCIDAGIPGTSFLDPDGSRNDMGAEGGPLAGWEYTPLVNHAPEGDEDVEYYTYEGTWTPIYAQNVRDEDGDPLFYWWDFDESDGLTYCDAFGSTPSYIWEDNGLYGVYLLASDPFGESVEIVYEVTVYNSDPSVTLDYSGSQGEGSAVDFYADASDPGTLDTFTFSFDWEDDGAYDLENGGNPFAEHTWYDNGVFTVRVKVKDDDGGEVESTATVVITNVDPSITSTPPAPAIAGEGYLYGVEVIDPGTLDTHEFELLNAPSGMEIDENGLLTWFPSVDDAGEVSFTIKVTDDDGGEGFQEVALPVEIPGDEPEGEGEVTTGDGGCDCSLLSIRGEAGGLFMLLLLFAALAPAFAATPES